MTHPVPSSSKFLAWFAIVNGVLTCAAPLAITYLSGRSLPSLIVVLYLFLGVVSAIAGYLGLIGKAEGFWLLFAVFLIQSLEIIWNGPSFSLIGPLAFKFGWDWYSPPFRLRFNILALVVCILAARAALAMGASAASDNSSAA